MADTKKHWSDEDTAVHDAPTDEPTDLVTPEATEIDVAARPMPVIVDRLSKIFHEESRGVVRAVDGVSFECREGEIFGLLGANGAGKTTTLRMLSTLLKPSGGRAMVVGHDVERYPEKVRADLGFFSASTALHPRLTARETLRLFAEVNGAPSDDLPRWVEYLIERFGIREFADARIDRLSTGMKQRVSIARVMAHDPSLLIFDEPTVGLDVLAALELRQVIDELRADGKTILFSTHILHEAETLCNRIAIIHRGRILTCESLEALRELTGKRYLEDIFLDILRQAGESSGVDPRAL